MDQNEVNDREWGDPENWRLGIYRSSLDSRLWVPKQRKWMGWTLNFAHGGAYFQFALLLLPAIVTVAISLLAASRK